MKKIIITAWLLILAISGVFAQTKMAPGYYAVFFTDKQDTVFSLDAPQKYLSGKAIERRTKFNIPIDSTDLPVSPVYIDSLKKLGFQIWLKSKWLNAVVVKCDDSLQLAKLDSLSFVKHDTNFHKPKPKTEQYAYKVKYDKGLLLDLDTLPDKYNYGQGATQINMLNGRYLHNLGYTGKGVTIAVLDAGFYKVNEFKAFEKMREEGRLLGWYDFVSNDTTVFNGGEHGLAALSDMASNEKGFVGTAPEASFWLFRTENGESEYKLEEFNWVCAAEFADSVGVDVISSSLGYNTFDDTTMNYTYEDMDGNTAISTIGADYAAQKGILVIVSAGNEGGDPWKYISAPADGDSVISVGAVNFRGKPAFFSSYGPTYDGRIKPDGSALGVFTTVIGGKGRITYLSGTSFSGPTYAGLVACLRQAHPDKSVKEIITALHMAGNKANDPEVQMGYGITDFYLAHLILTYYDFEKGKSTSPKLKVKKIKLN